MSFIPITIEKYIKLHLRINPKENETELRKRLQEALTAYDKGIKCSCGNDIWVVGSVTAGHRCFTCITGESYPTGDYEIEGALDKLDKDGRRNINLMDPGFIGGIFDDDGNEINPDLIKKPSLCLTCLKNYQPGIEDEMLCNLNRYDQRNDDNFKCGAYEKL
ncbi:MAG: hypothetical protein RBT35_07870 [Bacteroidales bacterium]|jgi:hypothetical protein|nr:hypothetical protein [Bacteroidales bacterium]